MPLRASETASAIQDAGTYAGYHRVGGVSVEVFWANHNALDDAWCTEDGWYWWACQPGCLPEGDPQGPFVTSIDAYEDAVAAYDEDQTNDQPPCGSDPR